MPSAVRPWARCQRLRARSVCGPEHAVGAHADARWSCRTSPPRDLTARLRRIRRARLDHRHARERRPRSAPPRPPPTRPGWGSREAGSRGRSPHGGLANAPATASIAPRGKIPAALSFDLVVGLTPTRSADGLAHLRYCGRGPSGPPGDSPLRLLAASGPRSPDHGSRRLGVERPSFYQAKVLQAAIFLAERPSARSAHRIQSPPWKRSLPASTTGPPSIPGSAWR